MLNAAALVSLNRDDSVRDGHMPGRLGAFNRRRIHRSLEDATREPCHALGAAAVVSGRVLSERLAQTALMLFRDRWRRLGVIESRQFVYALASAFIQTDPKASEPSPSSITILAIGGGSVTHYFTDSRLDTWHPGHLT